MTNSKPDSSLSLLRRQLLSAATPPSDGIESSDSVDFDQVEEPAIVTPELQSLLRPKSASPSKQEDVEAVLQQYQAERAMADPSGLRLPKRESLTNASRGLSGSRLGPRPTPARGLPPLTTTTHAELERLRTENAELKQLIEEYRELLEANDPTVWEQRLNDAQQALAEKDEQLKSLRAQVEEWEERFKTHRFVPHDDDLAREADELDKERARLTQERKELEAERLQLKEDEEAMMAQMREMEIGMAKDRAELARQRTELQRLQAEIQHEIEVLQRGDATIKERLAQFQRRCQDTSSRPGGNTAILSAVAVPPAPSPSTQTAGPKETAVFKKLFGQGR